MHVAIMRRQAECHTAWLALKTVHWDQYFLTRFCLPNDKKVLVSSHRSSPAKEQPAKML